MHTATKHRLEALCLAHPTVESCGFVILRFNGPLDIIHCANVAADPTKDFAISARDQAAARAQGSVMYVWHSHPMAAPFSDADRACADEACLPQRLFSIPDRTWYEYLPSSHRVPLEARPWAWGEADCLSIIRDYYRQQLNIHISDYDRDETTTNLGQMVMDGFEKEGFRKLPSTNLLQKHDVLIMRTNGSPQHMCVFVGNSRVLHHPLHGLSKLDLFSPAWRRRLHCVVRHQSQG